MAKLLTWDQLTYAELFSLVANTGDPNDPVGMGETMEHAFIQPDELEPVGPYRERQAWRDKKRADRAALVDMLIDSPLTMAQITAAVERMRTATVGA